MEKPQYRKLIQMNNPPDRSVDARRQARLDRDEHLLGKVGLDMIELRDRELEHGNAHDIEMEEANKRLSE